VAYELEHHIQTGIQIFASDLLAPTLKRNNHITNLPRFYNQEELNRKQLKYSQSIFRAITTVANPINQTKNKFYLLYQEDSPDYSSTMTPEHTTPVINKKVLKGVYFRHGISSLFN
jgi:hypothetical protein